MPPPKAWKVRLIVYELSIVWLTLVFQGCNSITRIYYQSLSPKHRTRIQDILPHIHQVRNLLYITPTVFYNLHTPRLKRLPKTYPELACPIFTIQDPMSGMSGERVMRLSQAIRSESQKNKGSEMVFHVCTFSSALLVRFFWSRWYLKPFWLHLCR